MIAKPINEITLEDLNLLLGSARESKTLEFKQEMPAKSNREVIQFLSAVSAFANTVGGDLLIGVVSTDGVASAIPGIPSLGFDSEKLRLEQLLADNIEPRLPPIAFHSVDLGSGNHAVIIRVPQSWLSPHRVSKNEKFYGRNSAGKYPLDVGELRQAFGLRESVAERIREFRRSRLLKIMAGDTPGRLLPSTSMVLHVIPLPSFGDRRLINVAQETETRPITLPVPLGSTGAGHGINLDGLFIYAGPSLNECHGHGLLFRDGAVEGVKQLSVREGTPYIVGAIFEQDVVRTLRVYMKLCEQLETGFPLYVALSFCNAKGCTFAYGGGGYWASNGVVLKDEVVALPECIVESATADVPGVLKPVFDMVWNAFGYSRSDKYDSNNKWIGTA